MAIYLSSSSDEECYKILSKDLFGKEVSTSKDIQNLINDKDNSISNESMNKLSVNQFISKIIIISKLLSNQLDNQTTVDKIILFIETIAKAKSLNALDRNLLLYTFYFTLSNTYQKSYFIEYFEENIDSLSLNDTKNHMALILKDYITCEINIIKTSSLIKIINTAIKNSSIPLLEVLGGLLKNTQLKEKIKSQSNEALASISKLEFVHISINTNISELLNGLVNESNYSAEIQLLNSILTKNFDSLNNSNYYFPNAEVLKTCQAICLNNLLVGKESITFKEFESMTKVININ
jgi:hypothetical protein